MTLWSSIRGLFKRMSETSRDGERGAYWCHDCEVRLLERADQPDPPTCPECGGKMEYERKAPSACC